MLTPALVGFWSASRSERLATVEDADYRGHCVRSTTSREVLQKILSSAENRILVSGQLHAPTALPLGKMLIIGETVYDPQPVGKFYKKFFCRESNSSSLLI
jgi:hypothetical protein